MPTGGRPQRRAAGRVGERPVGSQSGMGGRNKLAGRGPRRNAGAGTEDAKVLPEEKGQNKLERERGRNRRGGSTGQDPSRYDAAGGVNRAWIWTRGGGVGTLSQSAEGCMEWAR